jgi:hypothetical protein
MALEHEPELVAELRLRLEGAHAPLDDVLDGALTLAAWGYPALSRQYASRVAVAAPRQGRPDLAAQAQALLWTAYQGTGLA